ncbi:MAG TPA: hypothetical protein GXZ24_07615 [Firmicutes bacterium]|nr:hypothetical protein [Bacillota bacterium]
MPDKRDPLKVFVDDFLTKVWSNLRAKKKGTFLLLLLLLGVLLMFSSSIFRLFQDQPPVNYNQVESLPGGPFLQDPGNYEDELAEKLTCILKQIEGIEKVHVLITLETSKESVFAGITEESTKETVEKDTEGGTRDILERSRKEEYVLFKEGGGGEKALLVMEKKPRIAGIMIVARGAENSRIRLEVQRAIQSLVGLPAHRIAVLPWGDE